MRGQNSSVSSVTCRKKQSLSAGKGLEQMRPAPREAIRNWRGIDSGSWALGIGAQRASGGKKRVWGEGKHKISALVRDFGRTVNRRNKKTP